MTHFYSKHTNALTKTKMKATCSKNYFQIFQFI